jgi:hypothetical protein
MFIARQRSPFSRFTYDLFDQAGHAIGELCWPDFAVARNARLKSVVPQSFTTSIRLTCQGQACEVAFEYLSRDWSNDIRFFLTAGGQVIASADGIRSSKRVTRPTVTLTQPVAAALVRTGGLFSTRYALQAAGQTLGVVAEKSGFRLRRELVAELPESLTMPVQCFIIFLVLNHAYR